MSGIELLGVVIGVIFVYLLLSLICTALYEIIESLLKRRAANLMQGIRELLGDRDGTGIAKQLYEHPLVYGLYQEAYNPKKLRNLPSYIPARNFALALMDVVLPGSATTPSGATGAVVPPGTAPYSLKAFRDAVSQIQNDCVRHALLPLVDAAGNDASRARENIEAWYNSSMDRISGWYKRRAQQLIFGLGLVIAILINADTIAIVRSLSTDAALRESLVAAAQAYATTASPPTASPVPDPSSSIDACRRDSNSPECRVLRHANLVDQLGLPLGWEPSNPRSMPPLTVSALPAWLLKVTGWLLTALAISLGAPFWFDLLNKFLVIRSTVKPTEKSPEERSED